MNNQFDVAIIGLGPAGATVARLLSTDFKVIAIDKKDLNNNDGFEKPCGGLLAPDAQKIIAEMGLNLSTDTLVDPQIFAVKTIDLDSNNTKYYQRAYINMDRHKFDLWLEKYIPKNVQLHDKTLCKNIEKINDKYKITYCKNNQTNIVYSKFVIGADGAKSLVRNYLYPHKKLNSYISIQQWFNLGNQHPFYSCIFDSKNTDCYSWSISKNNYLIFGGAYPKTNARERFENQKKKLIKLGFVFGKPIKTEACLVLRPKGFKDFVTGYDNAFLIGEAAGFISPSSLEGISYGIKSGRILANVINSNTEHSNKLYNKKILGVKLKLMSKILKCPFLYNKFLRKLVMKSKIASIEVEEK